MRSVTSVACQLILRARYTAQRATFSYVTSAMRHRFNVNRA